MGTNVIFHQICAANVMHLHFVQIYSLDYAFIWLHIEIEFSSDHC